ncbi:hypothetical protein ISF_03829 [Cordyceps fumosorosea ARSEF 2679]|uniref:Uncharacterized protein n=1 Tax=Cordyceps fumosorosea (strain ARSEF 2679) TaxID=1081104 RepID=A0A167ZLC7_CORFA|nr:hypothetical protein ISF_03829 [Cordyceps fumosorosea ARSEF 2679]OAA67653.1 hypothetical protein ISF_03829 [Cordyceps fumosorosea ARSEF 2679]
MLCSNRAEGFVRSNWLARVKKKKEAHRLTTSLERAFISALANSDVMLRRRHPGAAARLGRPHRARRAASAAPLRPRARHRASRAPAVFMAVPDHRRHLLRPHPVQRPDADARDRAAVADPLRHRPAAVRLHRAAPGRRAALVWRAGGQGPRVAARQHGGVAWWHDRGRGQGGRAG